MIRSLGEALARFAGRWVPDPFSIALTLTVLSLLAAWAFTGLGPLELAGLWGGRVRDGALLPGEQGLWRLLEFAMQMCLILVTGHALASSRPVRALVGRLAAVPRTARQAVALTALTAMLAALVNWGLGLVVGALTAREVGLAARRRGLRVHYPLLGAAGYAGLMVWHGGLSGSAPLTVTQEGKLAALLGDPTLPPIPLGETLFSPMNLTVTAALLIAAPALLALMLPRDPAQIVEVDPAVAPEEAVVNNGVRRIRVEVGADPVPGDRGEPGGSPQRLPGPELPEIGRSRRISLFTAASEPPPAAAAAPTTPAERLDRSRLLAFVVGGLGLAYLVRYLGLIGWDKADLNSVNLLFLSLGLLLHASPVAYGAAIADAARGASGIILQFPFYAGIMGVMALSGLLEDVARAVVDVSGPLSYGPLTFASAGAVNLFVPSGGGQWAIQGPLVLDAARALDVPLGKAVMAFSYGDEWTNMLQPFWALPLLAITGLTARDLIGYTAALMLLSAPIYLGALLVF